MQPAVLSAVIASATSLVVAVATAVAQLRLQRTKSKQDSELERLKNELSDLSAERTARRSYEYEARKRLYAVTEPILFQLSERAEDLHASILGLARTARSGDLDPGRNWLSYDGYYLRSTILRLLAPVALFHLLQEGLTQVDLGLDQSTRAQYSISRYLAWALSDHYEFAAYERRIPYDPGVSGAGPGAGVPLQGLSSGIIDAAGESLIIRPSDGTVRVMRFGEFNDEYSKQNSKLYKACAPVARLLFDFHPRTPSRTVANTDCASPSLCRLHRHPRSGRCPARTIRQPRDSRLGILFLQNVAMITTGANLATRPTTLSS